MTTLQPKNRNRTDVAKLVTNNKEGRGFSMVAFSNYATRSIPIAVTKDGTKELNMCVLCSSSLQFQLQ